MMRHPRLLHIFISVLLVLKHLALADEVGEKFIFNGFKGASLKLNGVAVIHPNGLLELTNTAYEQIGRAFFPSQVSLNRTRPLSFSSNFVLAIVPEYHDLGGHGLAFVMSPSMDFPGALGAEFLGLLNETTNGLSSNHILAVEFDTTRSLDVEDIDNNHVGIDINGLVSNKSASAGYYSDGESGSNRSLQLISGSPIQVWIEYNETQKLLNVTLAPVTVSSKPTKPLLSTALDLSAILSDSVYVGFSAATGSMSSHHYILGWSFSEGGQAQSLDLSMLPSFPTPKKTNWNRDLEITISLASMIIVLLVAGPLYIHRRRKYAELREEWEQEYGPQRFSYKDLYKATRGFKNKELLGSGGFGRVYRGVLPSSNIQVAVKKVSHCSEQGMKEFVAEIASMGRLRHRNLVQLLGYCRRKGELLLVYDYMPNGSLDKVLFRNDKPSLDWSRRYQILRGVASALLYLHEEWEQVVVHRDVKASNILLDADLNGRLGDFGLARFHDHGSNPQTTSLVGTVGYIAPELIRTGRATTWSDVFSFGMFMLEMACGRRPVERERPSGELNLVDWVLACWRNESILQASDPRLDGNFVQEEMQLVLQLALLCAHPTPAVRPGMKQVAHYLDGNASLPDISLSSASEEGLIKIIQETSGDCSSAYPVSNDYPVDSWTSSSSILSCGR